MDIDKIEKELLKAYEEASDKIQTIVNPSSVFGFGIKTEAIHTFLNTVSDIVGESEGGKVEEGFNVGEIISHYYQSLIKM